MLMKTQKPKMPAAACVENLIGPPSDLGRAKHAIIMITDQIMLVTIHPNQPDTVTQRNLSSNPTADRYMAPIRNLMRELNVRPLYMA